MGVLDRANAFLPLEIGNTLPETFHFCPMDLGAEMVLGVVPIIEEEPIINLSVTANAPGYRFIGVAAVMPVIAVQIAEAMAEIKERKKIKDYVTPVEKK